MTSPEPTLRPVAEADCELLLAWANDAEVRRASFRSDPIVPAEHRAWFAARLADPRTRIYVLEVGGRPLGQIRFEEREGGALIGVSVAAEARGHGYGATAIRLGCERWFADGGAGPAVALVKPDNAASLAAFERAGFTQDGESWTDGQRAVRLTLARG